MDDAFHALRAYARERGLKLGATAEALVTRRLELDEVAAPRA